MKINLSPMLSDESTAISVKNDVLTVNSQAFDFSQLPEGATLPQQAVGSHLIRSDVTRSGGQIVVSVLFTHKADASDAARFPQPIITTKNGPVELPQ